jgi:hypothetical protein
MSGRKNVGVDHNTIQLALVEPHRNVEFGILVVTTLILIMSIVDLGLDIFNVQKSKWTEIVIGLVSLSIPAIVWFARTRHYRMFQVQEIDDKDNKLTTSKSNRLSFIIPKEHNGKYRNSYVSSV